MFPLYPNPQAKFAQLLRKFSGVFSKSEWDAGKFDLVQHLIVQYASSIALKFSNDPGVSNLIYV